MKVRYPLYWIGQWLSGWVPDAMAWKIAEGVSDLHWRRSKVECETVQWHLNLALGSHVSATSLLVREVFRNFGRYFVEFFQGHRARNLQLRIEGQHHLATAREGGRGVILLSAHLGNWELLGAVIAQHLGLPLSVVALPHEDVRVDALFNRQRERCGIEVIPLGVQASKRCLSVLRQGRVLGLIGDREYVGAGMPVSIFGRIARLPRGPALLSLRAQVPLVPIFMLREGPWRFRLCIEPPIWPQHKTAPVRLLTASPGLPEAGQGDKHETTLRSMMQEYATVLERHIRQAPTQWLLFRPLMPSDLGTIDAGGQHLEEARVG